MISEDDARLHESASITHKRLGQFDEARTCLAKAVQMYRAADNEQSARYCEQLLQELSSPLPGGRES